MHIVDVVLKDGQQAQHQQEDEVLRVLYCLYVCNNCSQILAQSRYRRANRWSVVACYATAADVDLLVVLEESVVLGVFEQSRRVHRFVDVVYTSSPWETVIKSNKSSLLVNVRASQVE